MSLDQEIEVMLRNGSTLTEVKNKLKVQHSLIKEVATKIEWDISWRNKKDKYEMHKEKYDEIFDLVVNQEHTLQEVGEKFNISRERVRQILVDMDIRIRDLQHEEQIQIKEELYELLLTGKYTPQTAADKLDVSYSIVDRVMKTFTPNQIDIYREKYITQHFHDTKKRFAKKMKIALQMWDTDVETQEIAVKMKITREYLNQLIIKCRKLYGWFPAKYGSRFVPENQEDVIKKLIIKDRIKRDPELAKYEKAKAKKAKEQRLKVKAERAKEKAKKEKEKAERLKARENSKKAKTKRKSKSVNS